MMPVGGDSRDLPRFICWQGYDQGLSMVESFDDPPAYELDLSPGICPVNL